jgi:hypothetical protein
MGCTAVLAMLVAGCESRSANGPDPVKTAQLAQCLTSKGAVLYGASWCPYTQQQIAAFGDAFAYINYIECTTSPEACENAGIGAYPTWIIGGARVEGCCELNALADWAGCDY